MALRSLQKCDQCHSRAGVTLAASERPRLILSARASGQTTERNQRGYRHR